MKEFEKWLKENSIKTGLLYDKQKEEQREIGWRAALEKILSQLKRPIYSADIMKWIEKELGDA